MSLAQVGRALAELVDAATDMQVELLRRIHAQMARFEGTVRTSSGIDGYAQRAVEGATDWRDLQQNRWGQ